MLRTCIAGLLVTASCASAVADTIILKSGQRVEGEVLKVQKDTLFVDIGVDVIRIPVDQIEQRITAEPEVKEDKRTENGVFMSAELPERTVKELVSTYGEGVVLVQTPDGLGPDSSSMIADTVSPTTTLWKGRHESP